jgi:hypothetical protein
VPRSQAKFDAQKRRTKTKTPGVFRSISGRYEIVYKDSSGKLRSEVIGDNFEEAKAARADRVATMARGGKVVRTRDNFGDYAETWIASLSRRPRTLDAYRYALDRHILPRFKNRRVADITADDVARMVSEMRRAGYS